MLKILSILWFLQEQHLSSDRSAADYKTAAQKIEEEPRKVQVSIIPCIFAYKEIFQVCLT